MHLLNDTIQTGPLRYRPQMNLTAREAVNQQRLAFIVGCVAIGLPTATILVGLFLATCFYDSISHYYYAQFWGSVFIGCLIFIGTYLLVWQGQSPGERKLASFAAPFAWGVALFPTSGAGCAQASWKARVFADFTTDPASGAINMVPRPAAAHFELLPWAETLHLASAAILFAVLAWFAIEVFTRIAPERDLIDPGGPVDDPANIRPGKRRRNRAYRRCGWIMVAAMAAIGLRAAYGALTGSDIPYWTTLNLTLVFEALALYAFGYSWMVKGGFWRRHYTD